MNKKAFQSSKFEKIIENAIFGTEILRNQLKFGILNPKTENRI